MLQSSGADLISWTNWIPAIIAGAASFGVAFWKSRSDLDALKTQVAFKHEETISALEAKYVSPLRSSALTLTRRMREIESKFQDDNYGEVRDWFKTAKDHVVGDARKGDFRIWCYYEGTFALSTLYYTGVYFRCVHDIYANSPFRELDAEFSAALEQRLENVKAAFDWDGGVWSPIQDVLGQRFFAASEADGALLSYEDMCELLDSREALKFGPFVRLLDVYWSTLDRAHTQAIHIALEELVTFIDVRTRAGEPRSSRR